MKSSYFWSIASEIFWKVYWPSKSGKCIYLQEWKHKYTILRCNLCIYFFLLLKIVAWFKFFIQNFALRNNGVTKRNNNRKSVSRISKTHKLKRGHRYLLDPRICLMILMVLWSISRSVFNIFSGSADYFFLIFSR